MASYYEKWRSLLFYTGDMNRTEFLSCLTSFYRTVNSQQPDDYLLSFIPMPRRVVWCASPAQANRLMFHAGCRGEMIVHPRHYVTPYIRTNKLTWSTCALNDAVRLLAPNPIPGTLAAWWLLKYQTRESFCSLFRDALVKIAEAGVFCWWAYLDAVFVCRCPSVIRLNEKDRLHAVNQPALEWPDGCMVYAIEGKVIRSSG